MDELLERACAQLKDGKPVLIYDADGREEETDICYASALVDYAAVKTLRTDAGGLVCCTATEPDALRLGLPFMTDVLKIASSEYPLLSMLSPHDIPYDAKSSFSLTINHRRTRTGITDMDRALTISQFAQLLSLEGDLSRNFGEGFRSPGHVHLLRASPGLVRDRQGHTELATALVRMCELTPSATICEMMGPDGKALPRRSAEEYARERGLIFLDGSRIIGAWQG